MFIPFDRYYLILVIPALLFAGWAQMSVSSPVIPCILRTRE